MLKTAMSYKIRWRHIAKNSNLPEQIQLLTRCVTFWKPDGDNSLEVE